MYISAATFLRRQTEHQSLRASIAELGAHHVISTVPEHFRERAMSGLLRGWLSGKRAAQRAMRECQEMPCVSA